MIKDISEFFVCSWSKLEIISNLGYYKNGLYLVMMFHQIHSIYSCIFKDRLVFFEVMQIYSVFSGKIFPISLLIF